MVEKYLNYMKIVVNELPTKKINSKIPDLNIIEFNKFNKTIVNFIKKINLQFKMYKNIILKIEKDFKSKYSKMDEYDNLKKDFIANISHELKTPMTSIIGYTFILRNKIKDEKDKQLINNLEENARILNDKIKNLLTITKNHNLPDKKDFKKFNVLDEIKSILQENKIFLKDKDLKIEVHYPGEKDIYDIFGDKDKILYIFRNIYNNAIKYTKKGLIKISIALSSKKVNIPKIELLNHNLLKYLGDKTLIIKIIDSGIGIPKKVIKNIYEPFYQVEKTINKENSGIGIGLFLVKKFITELLGNIEINSTYRKGTKVIVKIPVILKN